MFQTYINNGFSLIDTISKYLHVLTHYDIFHANDGTAYIN